MWANIIVAVITVVGVLVPAFWELRGDKRERVALKDLVEILNALPKDVERSHLVGHLETRFEVLAAKAHPDKVALARRRTRVRWTSVIGATITLLAVPILVVQSTRSPDQEPILPPWGFMLLMVVTSVAYIATLFGALGWVRVRRLSLEQELKEAEDRQVEAMRQLDLVRAEGEPQEPERVADSDHQGAQHGRKVVAPLGR